MANIKSARKRARQSVKRRLHNAARRSELRTTLKSVVRAIDSKNKKAAEAAYKIAEPLIDRLAAKRQIHDNKAARHKQRLTARIRALA
ncbi:MAG TPA: 30S ribosomal protein S20 [Gammaproteobacteria bacterium]|nr:30S ribosomal protein S20 [Gammaproteobacteria bacterium]